jgi:hypothetical protein
MIITINSEGERCSIIRKLKIANDSEYNINFNSDLIIRNELFSIDSISTWVKPQVLTIGIYTSQPVNVTDINNRLNSGTIWDMNLGVVVSTDSSFPGILFGPVAGKYMACFGRRLISRSASSALASFFMVESEGSEPPFSNSLTNSMPNFPSALR